MESRRKPVRSAGNHDRRLARVTIQLLGGFAVFADGIPVPPDAWKRRKARALVKLLAVSPGHALHREAIIDQLWPDLDPVAAGNSLRVALHLARNAPRSGSSPGNHPSSFLVQHDDHLHLWDDDPQELWIDTEQFMVAARTARGTDDVEMYQSAIDVYAGDLLPEDRYEDWATSPREALRETFLGLLLAAADLRVSRDEYHEAILTLERAVTLEPTLEEAHAGLMRIHALNGHHGLALRQYVRLRDVLARELDVEPSAAVQRLHADIASGALAPRDNGTVAERVSPVTPRYNHNLPVSISRFIGRTGAIAELQSCLKITRLLTLVGAGGSGKTRLAIEFARAAIDAYADGVWLVDLAPLRDPALVPRAVASALGIAEQPGQAVIDLLREGLRSRSLLLVFDNCEQVIDACAELVESLLHACPDLRIVATSREALRVSGEITWRVPLLSLPAQVPDASGWSPSYLQRVEESEAVTLFIDRVRWMTPDFILTNENASAVADICRRLDGLPLALELAAARAAILSLPEMLTRLDNAIGLLSDGGRTAPARQRTLQATLDWSYGLLDSTEQLLLQRLSVFAGSWTLDAAEAVCQGNSADGLTIDTSRILAVMADLVAKSLVHVENGGASSTVGSQLRYRLLETVRQYAAAHLDERGDAIQTRDRHAAFYHSLAMDAEPAFGGQMQTLWLDRLNHEHDNLRAALRWSIARGDVALEADICAILWRFWYLQGHFKEGDDWLRGLLGRLDACVVPPLVRAKVLQGAAAIAWNQGDPTRSERLSHQALPLFEGAGDTIGISVTLHALGVVAEMRGNYEEARTRYLAALRLREQLNDITGSATTLHNLANLDREQGNLAQAADLYERSVALQQSIGNTQGVALALSGMAVVALDQGDFDMSSALSRQSIELWRSLGAMARAITVMNNLGYAVMRQGDARQAATIQAECLRIAVEVGDKRGIAYGLEGLASALGSRDLTACDTGWSARLFGAAESLRERIEVPLPPADRALNEGPMSSARAILGESAFAAAWLMGQSAPLKETIAEALAMAEVPSMDRPEQPPPFAGQLHLLTSREREVAILVACGHSNREIATSLGMANRTVDTHVSNLLRKLGLASRAEVRPWARANDLALPDSH